jgi:hypothetical protein
MKAPSIARILGILFIVFGAAGFVPWIAPDAPFTAPVLALDTAYRMLFTLFAANAAADVLYIALGLWALAAALKFKSAVNYLRAQVWIFLLLVILGICPLLDTAFGSIPLYGWDVGLHVLVVLFAAFGGYGRGSMVEDAHAPAS